MSDLRYFDWTATSFMSENALLTYQNTVRDFPGNPSSIHRFGLMAKNKLEEVRKEFALCLNCSPNDVFFTSGGTESNSIIINSLLFSPSHGEVLTTAIEHSAILEHRAILEKNNWKFTSLRCPNGYLKLEDLEKSLNENTRLVCIMAVNNVVGTVQNLEEAVKIIREFEKKNGRKIHIHCDAVQALGKLTFNVVALDLDSASFSAHKFSGPRGVGILFCRNKSILALSKGGGQEKSLRPGTENLGGICATLTALKETLNNLDENYSKVLTYRKILENSVVNAGFSLISPSCSSEFFSPYILCISVKPLPSQVFIRIMSDRGYCLSAGSACSTNSKGKAESVLTAMNVKPEDRMSTIRISISQYNSLQEVNDLAMEFEHGKF